MITQLVINYFLQCMYTYFPLVGRGPISFVHFLTRAYQDSGTCEISFGTKNTDFHVFSLSKSTDNSINNFKYAYIEGDNHAPIELQFLLYNLKSIWILTIRHRHFSRCDNFVQFRRSLKCKSACLRGIERESEN